MGETAHAALKKTGANIRTIRKGQGLTQLAVAQKAGMDRSYLSQVENGKENIGLATLQAVAEALGVELKDIVALGEFPKEEETRVVDLAEGKPGRDVWLKVRHPLD